MIISNNNSPLFNNNNFTNHINKCLRFHFKHKPNNKFLRCLLNNNNHKCKDILHTVIRLLVKVIKIRMLKIKNKSRRLIMITKEICKCNNKLLECHLLNPSRLHQPQLTTLKIIYNRHNKSKVAHLEDSKIKIRCRCMVNISNINSNNNIHKWWVWEGCHQDMAKTHT